MQTDEQKYVPMCGKLILLSKKNHFSHIIVVSSKFKLVQLNILRFFSKLHILCNRCKQSFKDLEFVD